jgi:uncharacterized protein with FMN-binding domain
MNEHAQTSPWLRLKPLVYLLPAALTITLILVMLPRTQPVLAELPQRLERITQDEIETDTSTLSENDEAEPEDTEPQELLTGLYEDGVYTGSSQGYGGLVTVQVTVENGNITHIELLSASGETEPYWTLAQTILDTVYSQQTWEVDTVSGATYSSRGILGAIQNALTGETVENATPVKTSPAGTTVQDSFSEPAAYQDGVYYGSAEGFGGTIQVEVTISGGQIQNIRIISAAYETASYLRSAQTVISSILNAGSPNVDAVSGATYSSTGILNAVKRALSQASTNPKDESEREDETGGENQGGVSADDPMIGTPETNAPDGDNTETSVPGENVPDEDTSDKTLPGDDAPGDDDLETDTPSTSEYRDGLYTATQWCEDEDGTFRYELTVTVTVSDGKISAIAVEKTQDESEEPGDNDRYLLFALDGRTRKGVFYVGVPQQIIQNQSAETVDAVSGATYSSETIQRAVLQAIELSKASSPDEGDGDDHDRETTSSGEPSREPETETDPFVSEPPDVEMGEPEYLGDETELPEPQEPSAETEEGKQDEAE